MMKKKLFTIFLLLIFFVSCKSIPYERTDFFDSNDEEACHILSFPEDSDFSFYILNLQLQDALCTDYFGGIKTKVLNTMDFSIKIKAVLLNEEMETVADSAICILKPDDEEDVLFEFSQFYDSENIATVSFYTEGKLSGGEIIFSEIEFIK